MLVFRGDVEYYKDEMVKCIKSEFNNEHVAKTLKVNYYLCEDCILSCKILIY